MVNKIRSLADLRPGDIMFGPIGGVAGVIVAGGQLMLRESFRVGRMSVRHVGIVVEASRQLPPGTMRNLETGEYYPGGIKGKDQDWGVEYSTYHTGVQTAPRLAQAMPGGAEIVEMRQDTHWTDRHAYVRLPEDYPGQAEDAAAIARLMVAEGVGYSWGSYPALAAWRWGIRTPRLERWIGRRRPEKIAQLPSSHPYKVGEAGLKVRLPVEAICSVFADQAWTLAGKRVMEGTKPQVVTPGAMAVQLWQRPGVEWGGLGLL